jgi:hypothetical protein
MLALAEEAFREAERLGITGRDLLWDVAKEEIRDDLLAFLATDSEERAAAGTRPVWTEREFGMAGGDSLPGVSLRVQDRDVSFRGIIDRIDHNPRGDIWVVTDYKTGSDAAYTVLGRDPVGYGTRLQLPVYGLALAPVASADACIITRYLFVSAKGGYRSIAVPLNEVDSRFRDTVASIVAGIQSGFFPQVPRHPYTGEENCRFCDFARICPPNRERLAERKAGDVDYVSRYLVLGPQEAGS